MCLVSAYRRCGIRVVVEDARPLDCVTLCPWGGADSWSHLFACGDEAVLDECAEMAARRLRESAECIGPVPAPVYKVNDIYRKILYIKCEKCAILDQIRGQIETLAAADTKWQAVQIQYDIS